VYVYIKAKEGVDRVNERTRSALCWDWNLGVYCYISMVDGLGESSAVQCSLVPKTRNHTVPSPNTSEQQNKTEDRREKKNEVGIEWNGMRRDGNGSKAKEFVEGARGEGMRKGTYLDSSAYDGAIDSTSSFVG